MSFRHISNSRGKITSPTIIVIVCGGAILLGLYSAFKLEARKTYPASVVETGGQAKLPAQTLSVGATTIVAELAQSPNEKKSGLSGRNGLAEGHGMLFFFDTPSRYGFWMPEMRFSIDIVWIDRDWKIAFIAHDVHPDSYPNIITPDTPAQYVLEVPAGTAMKEGWEVGTSVIHSER